MLGIIGAMDVEVRTIKDKMTGTVTTRAAGCDFVTGELEGVMITVVQCAPGKVNAALCTQLLIDRFQVDRVINIGVACSLSERVVIKNIVIATDVCQYDIDITALGEPKGFINGLGTIKVATDPTLSDRLARTAINSGERIHRGTVASGDTFIGTAALKSAIAGEFDALCGDARHQRRRRRKRSHGLPHIQKNRRRTVCDDLNAICGGGANPGEPVLITRSQNYSGYILPPRQ